MADNQQDILSQTLMRLEKELTSFGTIQNVLKEASEKLMHAEKEWEKLTREQQQSAIELVNATKSAINATDVVTTQTKELADSLIPLAKAIETVNFPLRLDKIDMAAATQASTLASLQGVTERGFSDNRGALQNIEKGVTDGFCALSSAMTAASKRDTIISILLGINLAVLVAIVILMLMRTTPHG